MWRSQDSNLKTPLPIERGEGGNTFTNFGYIKNMGDYDDLKKIELGDMDGDGDLDVVIGGVYGHIFIYENRIPQKDKSEIGN